jgi:hypothetical protein
LFDVWVLLVRKYLFKIVLHENVPQFGDKPLRDALGDLYVLVRLELSPTDLGWQSRRPRQVCLLVLRVFLSTFVSPTLIQPSFDKVATDMLNFKAVMEHVFFKTCGFDFREYMIALPSEVEYLLVTLGARPKAGHSFSDCSVDTSAIPFCFLTPTETDRVCRYQRCLVIAPCCTSLSVL